MEKEHHGLLFGVLSAIANTILSVLIKGATDIPNLTIIFFRFAIGLFFLIPYAYRKSIPFTLSGVFKHLTRALFGLAAIGLYVVAVKLAPLVNVMALWNTTPLFIPLVVLIWMKVWISKRRFFSIFVGFFGVVVILRPVGFTEMGNLIALVSALFTAIGWVGIRQLSKSESTQAILLYFFVISTILTFFPMIMHWQPISDWRGWSILFSVGLLSYFSQYFTTLAFTHAPASKVGVTTYLTVIFGAFAGWWFFNEGMDLWDFVGAFLVIVGGVLTLMERSQPIKR